jgi:pyruvate kinase
VVAKIERAEAIENFDAILSAADAIMIARGDLGVQIPLQDVPAVQKKLIHQANLLGRPVITATQMLLSMTENIRPTRAEVSDVANAILDGTDAVMLSEETAIGRYPVETVEMISKIAISAERERKSISALADLPAYFRAAAGSGNATVEDVVTLNAVESAGALNVRYILTRYARQGRPVPDLQVQARLLDTVSWRRCKNEQPPGPFLWGSSGSPGWCNNRPCRQGRPVAGYGRHG